MFIFSSIIFILIAEICGIFKKSTHLCSAGHSLVGIDVNGNVLLCHGALTLNPSLQDGLVLGHVDNMDDVCRKLIYNKQYKELVGERCLYCNAIYCHRCKISRIMYSNK